MTQLSYSYKLVKTLSISLLFIILFALVSVDKISKILPYFYVHKYINVIDIEKLNKRNKHITNHTHISNNTLEYDKIALDIRIGELFYDEMKFR